MYHAIVRRRVVALFAAVSKGDARPVLEGLAPHFEHFFLGDHALGGSRFSLEKTRLWYERLYRLLPDISFRSARHPNFRAALEHSSCGGLAGKQFGDRRSPHLYARSPRRSAGVEQDDLYRNLCRHCRTCDDIAKVIASRCCGSDGPKNRRLVIALPVAV
jgi:hypothetical protein